MDILPRLRPPNKPNITTEKLTEIVVEEPQNLPINENKQENSDVKESKDFSPNQVFYIVIGAFILVGIIILIVYTFMTKYRSKSNEKDDDHDRDRKNKSDNKTSLTANTNTNKKSLTHDEIISKVSMDELQKYATKKAKVQIAEDKNTKATIEEIDTKMDTEITKKLSEPEDSSDDESPDDKDSLTDAGNEIAESIEEEIVKMEEKEFQPINQIDNKSGKVIKVYTSLSEIKETGLDYDRIRRVCLGKSKSGTYNKCKWNYIKN